MRVPQTCETSSATKPLVLLHIGIPSEAVSEVKDNNAESQTKKRSRNTEEASPSVFDHQRPSGDMKADIEFPLGQPKCR